MNDQAMSNAYAGNDLITRQGAATRGKLDCLTLVAVYRDWCKSRSIQRTICCCGGGDQWMIGSEAACDNRGQALAQADIGVFPA